MSCVHVSCASPAAQLEGGRDAAVEAEAGVGSEEERPGRKRPRLREGEHKLRAGETGAGNRDPPQLS